MRHIDIFPDRINFNKDEPEMQNLQIQLYGRRIRKDQTFYEYLIEFLLVFVGERDGKSGFRKIENYNDAVSYEYVNNIALKRFIFLKDSKKDNVYDIDKGANELLENKLKSNIKVEYLEKDDVISIIRELYLGFTAYSGDRGWFAKAILPIDKTTILPEAMGKKGDRKKLQLFENGKLNKKVDSAFEFKEHNFMARGGEVYFLHLIQGLKCISENNTDDHIRIKEELDFRLNKLVSSFPQFKEISTWINEAWVDTKKEKLCEDNNEKIEYKCKWISKNYERRSVYSVKELLNILRAEINEFDKFDLLCITVIMQTLRMMTEAATLVATDGAYYNSPWVIHVNSIDNDKVKRLAIESYKNVEENMIIAISKMLDNFDEIEKSNKRKKRTHLSLLKDAYDDSHKLLRSLGKKIGFIIPIKGNNMRFTLTDNIVKFFVLSLVEPNKKITLDTFINKLHRSFGVIIGPNEYEEYLNEEGLSEDISYLHYNLEEFQLLLRKNGFLKELSDATSIVINPYSIEELK